MGKALELEGQRFSRLVVRERLRSNKWGKVQWDCKCDCGNIVVVTTEQLRSGHTKSCGCLQKERTSKARKTHGHKTNGVVTRTYIAWQSMRKRCDNPKNKNYKYYGGRGITVCKRWLKFENFLADMGKAPEGLTLDRKDNDGSYEPDNCRWITQTEQNQNSRWTKLTPIKVKQIRRLAKDSQFTMKNLARTFSVSISCIEKVVYRTTWANIN